MVNILDLVNPNYQRTVDAALNTSKAAAADESAETTEAAGTTETTTETAAPETAEKANEDTYEPEDKEAVEAEKEAAAYKPNTALVEQLKAEQAQLQTRFVNMVKDMLGKQGKTISEGDGIWRFLASGDYEVDEETQKAAQEAIAEDGYWGVKQTSERIIGFAKALVGGDPSKIDLMKDAFEKGYAAAGKAWGGVLPEISQQTRSAVLDLFDEWENEGKTSEEDGEDTDKVEDSGETEASEE